MLCTKPVTSIPTKTMTSGQELPPVVVTIDVQDKDEIAIFSGS